MDLVGGHVAETRAEMLQPNHRFRGRGGGREDLSDLDETWFDPLSVQDDGFASYSFVEIDVGILDDIGVDGQEHVS